MGLDSEHRRGLPEVVRDIPRVAVAATNNAWVVAIVLLTAAAALALEMAASFK